METTYKPTRSKGIYKTQYGKYRVRKQVNGRKMSRNFSKFKEALAYKNTICK